MVSPFPIEVARETDQGREGTVILDTVGMMNWGQTFTACCSQMSTPKKTEERGSGNSPKPLC